MLGVIAYIFDELEEVTPLMLQKLLYFIQGVYSALYGRSHIMKNLGWKRGKDVVTVFRPVNFSRKRGS